MNQEMIERYIYKPSVPMSELQENLKKAIIYLSRTPIEALADPWMHTFNLTKDGVYMTCPIQRIVNEFVLPWHLPGMHIGTVDLTGIQAWLGITRQQREDIICLYDEQKNREDGKMAVLAYMRRIYRERQLGASTGA